MLVGDNQNQHWGLQEGSQHVALFAEAIIFLHAAQWMFRPVENFLLRKKETFDMRFRHPNVYVLQYSICLSRLFLINNASSRSIKPRSETPAWFFREPRDKHKRHHIKFGKPRSWPQRPANNSSAGFGTSIDVKLVRHMVQTFIFQHMQITNYSKLKP